MNGIEKITQQIAADAQAEAEKILTEARAEAAAIAADYAKQAEKAAADVAARGTSAAEQREERLASVAAMEGRKEFLAVKQEMVNKAFDLAHEKLCALPDEAYIELVAKLAVKAVVTGEEQVVLSQKDRARVGKEVVMAANEKLGEKGKLTLSERTADIAGGLILVDGDVEVNCTFETMIRMAKTDMAGKVANVLFE